jgi:hypothetical protein
MSNKKRVGFVYPFRAGVYGGWRRLRETRIQTSFEGFATSLFKPAMDWLKSTLESEVKCTVNLTEFLGYAAASMVLATFAVRSIVTLRCLAIASNLLFISYALSAQIVPVFILHMLLLPLNLWRLREVLGRNAFGA